MTLDSWLVYLLTELYLQLMACWLNMFRVILRNLYKHGSWLKNPVLSSDVEQCFKCHEAFRKHHLNMLTCLEAFKKYFENTVLGSKIRFSAQMSNNAKKKHETPRKHQLNMFWGFSRISWKSLFSAQKSGSRLRCRTMLKKYTETPRKHQQNMFWGFLRNSWKSGSRLKNVVLSTDFELC